MDINSTTEKNYVKEWQDIEEPINIVYKQYKPPQTPS